MLPKAYLTLHCRMSDSRWVTTPRWLSGSLRLFFVYSCHFFLISSASFQSLSFLSFIVPILAQNVPFNFLEEISSLSYSIVFLCIFFFFLHFSHKKAFLPLLVFSGTLYSIGCIFPFSLCLSLLFFSQLFVRPSQIASLPSCIPFSWDWFWWSPPVQCYALPSIFLQTLSTRSNPLNLFVTSTV